MFIFKLLSFLTGYVRIMVRGNNLEKFINMAAGRGIFLWDIKRLDSRNILVSARLSAVHPLRHIARATKCRFEFKDREGLPFLLSRARRRKSLLAGAAVFLLGMYMLSSFIWFVDIEGNKKITDGQILESASKAGLKKWVFKWNFTPSRVESVIKEDYPEISWAGVYVRGTRVKIQVAEKVIPGVRDEHPAHIVAAKAGLIKEILVLSGNPAVKEGDTVVPGQILISGIIPGPGLSIEGENNPGQERSGVMENTIVQAKGLVRARVWYEGYGEALLEEKITRLTGDEVSRVCMKIAGKEIILKGPKNIPFIESTGESQVKKPLQWRNISVPVELITEKYHETERYTEQRTRGQALALAEQRAMAQVSRVMPSGSRVMVREVKEVSVKNPENLVRISVFVETLEDIGVEKQFKP
ncbi:stage IV sporulation protein [Desulfocucumis palustris]|uniref:Stage IV sporulation protein n=1 Tax=Desulfocucumis palustris TaxID=1898651 RepID=A0A2L2XCN8_9FIRM|nr:sporulation protein YqfD [Desulfocucumis palustris]GBF33764.1 stage IV sporulation protein [Desulfocucumis palustris]